MKKLTKKPKNQKKIGLYAKYFVSKVHGKIDEITDYILKYHKK